MPRQAKEATHDDKSNKDNESDDDDDDDDEVELRALAAAWVNERDEESAPAKATPPTTRSASSLSLHISQLPFDTTEWELRQFFVTHAGCTFQALRLVYDAGVEQERVFRGVAFGECSNQAQYQAALALHQSHQHKIKGRRINVRPTRTKEELASIVQERNALVRTKLQALSQKRKQSTSATSRDNRNLDRDNKKTTSKRQRKDVSSPSSNTKTHRERKQPHNDNKKKLTKKERNRRAAIIMAKKRTTK